MLEQTDTKIDDYLNFYGVDRLVDLYEDEAAKIINSLLRKLSQQRAEEEDAKKLEDKKGKAKDGK